MDTIPKLKLGAFLLTGFACSLAVYTQFGHENATSINTPVETPLITKINTEFFADAISTNKDQTIAPVQESSHVQKSVLTSQDYQSASRYGVLPVHLADIAMARLSYDEHGNFLVTEKLKQLIEQLLSARSEEGYDIAVARIHEYIDMALPEKAAKQAIVIVEQYLAYKNKLAPQDFSFDGESDVSGVIQKLSAAIEEKKTLRAKHFSESTAQIFFGNEQAYDAFSLRAIEISNNPTLSTAEKDEHIAAQENLLPAKMAKRLRHKRLEKNLKDTVKALQSSDGNTEEIYTLRKDFYGEKVADRMHYLEDSSDEWLIKVDQYKYEEQNILSQEHLSSLEKQSQITLAKNSLFSPKEQIKLSVQTIRDRVENGRLL